MDELIGQLAEDETRVVPVSTLACGGRGLTPPCCYGAPWTAQWTWCRIGAGGSNNYLCG